MSRVRRIAHDLLPDWIETEWRLRTRYRVMRQGEVWGYSFVPLDEHRCIFVHIPKSAGVSVAQALFHNMGPGHIPMRVFRRIFGPEDFDAYFKFAFVRNPFDRLVSAYTFLKGGGMDKDDRRFAERELGRFDDFKDFVRGWVTERNVARGLHFIPQHDWLCLPDGSLPVDFLGRFENLPQDFATIAERLGIETALEHRNATRGRRPYSTYYDEETVDIVRSVYRKDFELLGYDPEDLGGPESGKADSAPS